MTRLERAFAAIRADQRTGLVTYVTAGDPDLRRSAGVIQALDRAGADVIEVGVPFSDPLADGPVIQRASERARRAGTTLASVLTMLAEIRPAVSAPLVLFTYANPIWRVGRQAFVERAAAAGVDGVLVLDVPMEEAGELHAAVTGAGLATIFLVSPTTSDERLREAGRLGAGFLYGISRLGVTGARDRLADTAAVLAGRMRRETALPVAIGFGLSTPEHVRAVGQWADAAVVGSALVDVVDRYGNDGELEAHVEGYVRWLKGEGRPVEVATS